MKQFLVTMVLGGALIAGAVAESPAAWAEARSTVKVADLTVGDLKAWADAQSIERQERRYVYGSSFSSFLLPGLGQFKVGDPVGGTLNLAGHIAVVGGTMYGVWALLPSDLKKSGLSRDERHDRMSDYLHNDPAKVAPALGVMAGGVALTLVHRFWAASDAKTQALANLESGAVTFEPALFQGGLGFRMRM